MVHFRWSWCLFLLFLVRSYGVLSQTNITSDEHETSDMLPVLLPTDEETNAIVDEILEDELLTQSPNSKEQDFGTGTLPDSVGDTSRRRYPVTEEEINLAQHVAGNYYSGDMRLTKEQQEMISGNPKYKSMDAVKATTRYWANGVVPYVFAAGFKGKQAVLDAIEEYNQKTCIKFIPWRRNEANYIEFINGGGCWSWVGMGGGKQQISLGQGCGRKGIAVHEMMHALGYFHEQSRPDRDKYITVVWDNIIPQFKSNFRVAESNAQGTDYDYQSVMHYPERAFAINPSKKTIIVKTNGVMVGQRNGLSVTDALSLRKLYCDGTEKPVTTKIKPETKVTPKKVTFKKKVVIKKKISKKVGVKSDKLTFCRSILYRRFNLCRYCGMKELCGRSCDSRNVRNRRNMDRLCQRYAVRNYCTSTRYSGYMWKYCPKSCVSKAKCK